MTNTKTYEVDFSYKMPEFGKVDVEATSVEHAENQGLRYIKDTYPDVVDIQIETVKEVK